MMVSIELHNKNKRVFIEPSIRVVVHPPEYENGDAAMLHRTEDAHFVNIMTDVPYWAYDDKIKPIDNN